MSGFDVNRFVGLEHWLSEQLICSICLNVFSNAVDTQCSHTFCSQCIRTSIRTNGLRCPQCRQTIVSRKRTRSGDNVHNINEPILSNNKAIDGIISKLKIKCDFESNGCREVIELSSLATHLKTCDYNFGQIRAERNELIECKRKLIETKDKLMKSETKNRELDLKCKKLKDKCNDLKTRSDYFEANKREFEDKVEELERKCNDFEIKSLQLELKCSEFEAKNSDLEYKCNEFEVKNSDINERYSALRVRSRETDHKIKDLEMRLDNSRIAFVKHMRLFREYKNSKSDSKTNTKSDDNLENKSSQSLVKEFKFPFVTHLELIMFGTYSTVANNVEFNITGIRMTKVIANSVLKKCQKYTIYIPFIEMKQLMYCLDPILPLIIVKPNQDSNNTIQVCLGLGESSSNGLKLDINSKDPREHYIVIQLNERIDDKLVEKLILYSVLSNKSIKCKSIDVNKAKPFVDKIQKLCRQVLDNPSKHTNSSLSRALDSTTNPTLVLDVSSDADSD